jgi:hypothetical protein
MSMTGIEGSATAVSSRAAARERRHGGTRALYPGTAPHPTDEVGVVLTLKKGAISDSPPTIQIIGDARRILGVLAGQKDARTHFLAGGFRVRGDLRYLSDLAVELGIPNYYNGPDFPSDPNRGGLGYPAAWTSFHPELLDPTRPDMMDNYWLAFDDPQLCRHNGLTRAWYTDRLRAFLNSG